MTPTCGKCGLPMTPADSRIHPEFFLHDACLPDEMKPRTPTDVKKCDHHDFACCVTVNRLEDERRFMADVTVQCTECGTPFRFVGLPTGLDLNGASASVDGTEARLAIAPKGEVTTPIEGVQGFTVRKTADTPLSRSYVLAVINERLGWHKDNLAGWREGTGYLCPTEPDLDERRRVRAHLTVAVEVLEELQKALGLE